jgi:hypothetical protein
VRAISRDNPGFFHPYAQTHTARLAGLNLCADKTFSGSGSRRGHNSWQ